MAKKGRSKTDGSRGSGKKHYPAIDKGGEFSFAMFYRAQLFALAFGLLAMVGVARAADTLPVEMKLEALPQNAPAPTDNAMTGPKVALGRLLFFDPILSATQKVACATCHHPSLGWADGRATPIGIGGAGLGPSRVRRDVVAMAALLRNAPSLLNVGFNGLVAGHPLDPRAAPMFWDGREQGLEAQVLHPIGAGAEMRGDTMATASMAEAVARVATVPEYRRLFAEAGERAVTVDGLTRSIASFERSLVAANSPFDRFMRGETSALDAAQQRGMKVFERAGCIQCHGGPMFSDFKRHSIGVNVTAGEATNEFRTPTLRNLKQTGPYMHDGSQRSLLDVLNFYDQLSDEVSETLDGGDAARQPPLDPLLKHLQLTPEDFPGLMAFLEALNDDHYDRSVPDQVPSGLTVGGQ